MSTLDIRRAEFNEFVWDHSADPFQASFDERRELNSNELKFLVAVHQAALNADDAAAIQGLRDVLLKNVDGFALVLQVVGLTRNKILSDLRASSAAKNYVVPSSFTGIPKSAVWKFAGPYLLKRLRAVIGLLDPSNQNALKQCFQALNQSTWPGYIRQERAKRSGHEAEYRLATLMSSLKIPFAPAEKAENPLCAQIDGISFDLVIPDEHKPKVIFKSTVHTANIGQYGESKDHLEVDEARRWLDTLPKGRRPVLVAFVDGIGFRSNSAGLNGVLTKTDEFCQFRTIWKAAMVAGHATGIKHTVYLPKAQLSRFAEFIQRYDYKGRCHPKEELKKITGAIEAGDALIELTS